MSPTNLPHGGPPNQAELPRCSRDFVHEASKLHRAGLSKENVLEILKHSGAVFEFVKIAGMLKFINIDNYVMENLITSIWEEKIS
jgi:hypothetical protein